MALGAMERLSLTKCGAHVNTARPGAGNPTLIMLNRMFRKYMFDEETLVGTVGVLLQR